MEMAVSFKEVHPICKITRFGIYIGKFSALEQWFASVYASSGGIQ
jgi:hypothetical protein